MLINHNDSIIAGVLTIGVLITVPNCLCRIGTVQLSVTYEYMYMYSVKELTRHGYRKEDLSVVIGMIICTSKARR